MSNEGNFRNILDWEMQFGERIRLLGFPAADSFGKTGIFTSDELGIVSHARNKDGVWDFLEYYYTLFGYQLSTMKSAFRGSAEKTVHATFKSGGIIMGSVDGEAYYYKDMMSEEHAQELVDAMAEAIENVDFTSRSEAEEQVISIVAEEAASYYNGDKSLEEVTAIIQNRVSLLLQEKSMIKQSIYLGDCPGRI